MWYPLNVFYVMGCLLNSPHHMRILTNANISSVASYVKITELIFLLAALHGLSIRCGTWVVYWPCSCLWLACWLWNPVAETISLYVLLLFGGSFLIEVHLSDIFTQSDFDNEKGRPQANVNNGFCPLPLWSVADLKHAIHSKYKIAIQHQVLVVNGGECMAADRRVCTYSAGTVGARPPWRGRAPAFQRLGTGVWLLQRAVCIFCVCITVYFSSSLFLFFTSLGHKSNFSF